MDTEGRITRLRLDAAALRVLAHPLRSRLLSALRRDGPATATDLATLLDSNTGATSYHLRKLESVGLVADTKQGKGKRRVWRAATDSHQLQPGDFVGDDAAEADLNWLQRSYSRDLGGRYEAWLDVEGSWSTAWRDAFGMNDDIVTLTPAQTQAMTAEIGEVVQRYRSAGSGDPAARRLSISRVVYPLDLDPTPDENHQ